MKNLLFVTWYGLAFILGAWRLRRDPGDSIVIVILLAIPSSATQAIAADMSRRAQSVAEELSAKKLY